MGGTLLVILASVLDAMDGNIARTYGKTTRYGDYLDHTIDRVVDIALLLVAAVVTAMLLTRNGATVNERIQS